MGVQVCVKMVAFPSKSHIDTLFLFLFFLLSFFFRDPNILWFFFWSPFAANPKRGASTASFFGRPWPALSSPATAPSARWDASVMSEGRGGDKIERAQADPEMAGLVQAEKARGAEVKNLELNWNTELTVCDIGAGECLQHSIIYLVKHPARSTQNEVFVTREGCLCALRMT